MTVFEAVRSLTPGGTFRDESIALARPRCGRQRGNRRARCGVETVQRGALTPGSDEHEFSLQPGDVLAVFTDGLFEPRDRPFDAGLEELGRIVDEHRSESVESIADAVMREASPSVGWDDDVALLVGRRRERSGG